MALGPRICWGVKVKGKQRLRCDEPVSDPRVVEETMKLINEFLARVERHRAVLLGESSTPFDHAINSLGNWLSLIKARIKENNDEGIARLRGGAMHEVSMKMLGLAKRAREEWLSTYRGELVKLLNRLRSSETTIIIRGEPLDGSKGFNAYMHTDRLTIRVGRVARTRGAWRLL